MQQLYSLSVGLGARFSVNGDCIFSTLGSVRLGSGALGAGGGWLLFSTTLPGAAPSGCLKTGISGLLEAPSTGLRLEDEEEGEEGSALLWGGSGILEAGAEASWESTLLGGAGGSWGRDKLSSARLCVEVEMGVEELSRVAPRLPRFTSGRLRPKRAMPALGELSICLDDTSMEISVRRDEARSGLRPPDSSMRLMLVLGERGLEDSEGEVLAEEEKSELREPRS